MLANVLLGPALELNPFVSIDCMLLWSMQEILAMEWFVLRVIAMALWTLATDFATIQVDLNFVHMQWVQ
jgi:hypothetical protein